MPHCDTGFQVVSEQRAILRQALLYKKQWEREERQQQQQQHDADVEAAANTKADGPSRRHGAAKSTLHSNRRITPQQLELYNSEVSLAISEAKRRNSAVAGGGSAAGDSQSRLPPIGLLKRSGSTASSAAAGGAARQHVNTFTVTSAVNKKGPPKQHPSSSSTNYFIPAVPASVAMQSTRSSQPSHHAVSSVCEDASEISRFSERMKALEEKLMREEAMRLKVSEELREMKQLLMASSDAGGARKKGLPPTRRRAPSSKGAVAGRR